MYYQQPFQPYLRMQLPKKKLIKVTGEGRVAVQPDKATITLGVNTEDQNLETAQANNSKHMNDVIRSLESIGINKQNIQTSEYSIYPLYEYKEGEQIFRGYKVNHMITIAISEIDKVGAIVDTAVQNGANSVSQIQFSVSNPNAYYQQALIIALQTAEQKAATIAHSLGVQLVQPPILITEGSQMNGGPIPFEASTQVKGVSTTPIEPGQLEIEASLRVEYPYE
ncbi:SIMPL domain-containing protein [Cytobacillus spongiae]|uniref:SIMPL domain-containing protein n=1 Tax=Cytobacillus spongiae TaxID=2901381 RepID=UPI001F4164DC|nr:SIMPL domain-containing protein [Cytobacillus spongiae]UII54810.1 SIMPL domain-containing protein [Cytobacillus spongiae]